MSRATAWEGFAIIASQDDSRLLLPAEADSVAQARRHIAGVLERCGLDEEQIDVARLLVSEIVTNALLHAGTDIEIRCLSDEGCTRISVADRSPNQPAVRHYQATATTGRGLGLVEALATRWGVHDEGMGKAVWFELGERETGAAPAEQEPAEQAEEARPGPTVSIRFSNLPVEMVRTTVEYSESSLRELALIALEEDREWAPPALDLGPLLRELEDAAARVQQHADLVIEFPEGSERAALARLALVDESDALAREGRTLTPPALPEITSCRRWLYRQIGLQPDGLDPEPWELPAPSPAAGIGPEIELDHLAAIAPPDVAVVVADDANRIVHATDPAAELLGWEAEELRGRRLVSIVPPEHREAHLAGFERHQLTGEKRLIGTTVTVPVLHRDGRSLLVHLTLREVAVDGGHHVFAGTLELADPAVGRT